MERRGLLSPFGAHRSMNPPCELWLSTFADAALQLPFPDLYQSARRFAYSQFLGPGTGHFSPPELLFYLCFLVIASRIRVRADAVIKGCGMTALS